MASSDPGLWIIIVRQGDAVYATGIGMGKLLRTVFLCDYFGNPPFRNSILDVLNQGEAVHSLQRGIHPAQSRPSTGARSKR